MLKDFIHTGFSDEIYAGRYGHCKFTRKTQKIYTQNTKKLLKKLQSVKKADNF